MSRLTRTSRDEIYRYIAFLCKGKRCHTTREKAMNDLQGYIRRNTPRARLRVYKCQICRSWHFADGALVDKFKSPIKAQYRQKVEQDHAVQQVS